HVIARECIERGGRDHVEQERADAAALQLVGIVGIGVERFGIERGRIDVHAVPRAEYRLDADPADLLALAGAGNAVHDDTEHDRRHDHRDQLEEGVAQDLEADGKVGNGHAENDAEDQGRKDLDEQ
ncbi:hypothetical protein E4T56_gene17866, partial [Termitomyces sp. T112]